jgi:hypothetical protein
MAIQVPGEDGLSHPGVMVRAIFAGRHSFLRSEPFGLFVSEHALGRMVDRAPTETDPVKAVLQAHDALMALHPTEGDRIFALDDITLAAGPGAFLVSPGTMPDGSPMATARTWIFDGQAFDDQTLHIRDWRRLLTAPVAV